MADDFYKILGVNRDASVEAIQKAYRKLARKHHPDVNPDDKTAKKRFQEIQHAYDVLNDPKKRELYDRFGPNFEQAGMGGGPQPHGGGGRPGAGPQGFENVDFSEMFGGGGGGAGGFADFFQQFTRGAQQPRGGPQQRRRRTMNELERGADVEAAVEIPFEVSITGGEQELALSRGDKVDTIRVKIPAGIEDGKKIRLRGQGQPGPAIGTDAGDLLVTIRVAQHPYFSRRGENLYVKLPVTLLEAAEGAKVDVPTPIGTVALRIPPGSTSGTKLRIRGHGVKSKSKPEPGDLFAELQVMLPKFDEDELAWLRASAEKHPLEPRDKLRW